MIEALETAIIERLKPAFPTALVDAFPDKFDGYEKLPTNRGAAILVAYRGSDYGEPRPMGMVVQEQRPQFEVTVVAKSLRGHQGALALLDGVRRRLTGHRPAGAEPMRPLDEQYVPSPPGHWVYAMIWATSFPHVEELEAETEAPYSAATFINETTDEAWTVDLATQEVTPAEMPEE